jgi:hypothetical protein
MHQVHHDDIEPWQRNPWVWLVIAIPGLTVVGCLFTMYLALANPDYLVDEYVTGAASAEQGRTEK